MLLTMALIVVVSILPGFALARILDASSDRLRKILLAPALGLLLIYGVNGTLLLLNIWSVFSTSVFLFVVSMDKT